MGFRRRIPLGCVGNRVGEHILVRYGLFLYLQGGVCQPVIFLSGTAVGGMFEDGLSERWAFREHRGAMNRRQDQISWCGAQRIQIETMFFDGFHEEGGQHTEQSTLPVFFGCKPFHGL